MDKIEIGYTVEKERWMEAAENMKCPYHYPASLLGTGVVIMDEIGPWPPKGKGR